MSKRVFAARGYFFEGLSDARDTTRRNESLPRRGATCQPRATPWAAMFPPFGPARFLKPLEPIFFRAFGLPDPAIARADATTILHLARHNANHVRRAQSLTRDLPRCPEVSTSWEYPK